MFNLSQIGTEGTGDRLRMKSLTGVLVAHTAEQGSERGIAGKGLEFLGNPSF